MSFPCFKTAAVSDNALKNKKNIHKTIIFKRKMQEKQKKNHFFTGKNHKLELYFLIITVFKK